MISVGVDIGNYSIKIAEVESTSKSYVVRRVLEFPLSLDLTKDKKIEIIDTLRTFFQQIRAEKMHFVFSIPQNAVSMRRLEFPFRERFKIQKAVVAQLEDDLPFSQEDAVFDTKIVRFLGKGAEVLAMAVPRERVADMLSLGHDCGVEPSVVSTECLALGNLFEKWIEPPPDVPPIAQELPTARPGDLILNIGHLNSTLLVYSDGVMVGARAVDWGAKNLADAIGAKYGLNYIQAMRELQLKGFILIDQSQGTKEQVAFSQVIEKSLQELISGMRLRMLEMQSQYNLQWARALVIGGGSQLKNLCPYLTQNFELPFNRYRQFESHPPVEFEVTPQLEAVSAVAVGLAIEGIKRPRNPATNFLKGEFAHQTNLFETLWARWGYTAQLAGTAFLILFAYAMTRDAFTQRLVDESDHALATQAEAIAGLKASKASPTNVQRFLNNVDKEAKKRKAAQKVVHLNSALDIINKISAAMPPARQLPVEIKRIAIDNEIAEVHGYGNTAADNGRVAQVLQQVSANNRVETLTNHLVKAPAGKIPFSYRFRIQRLAGGG